MLERMSTNLLFSISSRSIQESQSGILNLSRKINTGKRFTNPTDDPVGIIGATHVAGRILNNDQGIRDREKAISDMQAQEVALDNIIDLSDKIYEITVAAGNETLSAQDRILYRDEMRTFGESIVQLVNSTVGNRFIFSGQQADLQTLRLQDGAAFDQAVYKHNQDNGLEREVANAQASVSLEQALLGQPDGAVLTNRIINPVTTVAGNMDFEVEDGNGNIINFTINPPIGTNLGALIAAINAAYTGAGGAGAIAQESPAGYLRMDTDLMGGSAQNATARISVLSTSTIGLTNELGVNRQDNFGREMGLLRTFTDIENALTGNNPAVLRQRLYDLKFNLDELNQQRSKIGLLTSQAEVFNDSAVNLDLKLQSDLSSQQDLDIIEASTQMSTLQLALQTAVQTTSNLFSLSLANFIGG